MADETRIKDENDLALDLAIQERIKEKIAMAILKDETTTDLGDRVIVNIKMLEDNNDQTTYDLDFETEDLGQAIKDKKSNKVNIQLDMKKINFIMQNKLRKNIQIEDAIEEYRVDGRDSEALKQEVEVGLRNGNAVRMEIDREISSTENMRMFVNRAWGISAQEIYRVKGKGSHDFKYVAKTSKGNYEEINLSSRSEGKNPNQKIWIMKDGKIERKGVDSLLIKGEYAIATDVPDNVASSNKTTYLVRRTPRGEYIAIAAGQKYGVNRNTSGDSIQKDIMSRENSVYDLEDVIKAAIIAEQIYGINKDGKLTTKELEMVRRFKFDKNMGNKEVIDTVETIVELKEMGYGCNEIKQILDARSKEEIAKLANKVKQNEIEKEDIEENAKLPGGRRTKD